MNTGKADQAMRSRDMDVYIDLRSPYSYIAIKPIRAFAQETGLGLRWHPYAIDIAAAYGSADARDVRALRKVKYIYRDARRLGEAQGLEIRGARRIYDATLAHIGMLFAQRSGFLDAYIDNFYERFFSHAIEIEDGAEIRRIITELGGSAEEFTTYAKTQGPDTLNKETEAAEALGVFGVPTFAYDGEIYWGSDRLPMLRQRL